MLEAGQKYQDRKKNIIEILSVVQEGYDPDDPLDCGSFEEWIVTYELNDKRYQKQDYEVDIYLDRNGFELMAM